MNRHLITAFPTAGAPDGTGGPRSASDRDERGASLVEYTLMLSLILLVALASVSAFGSSVGDSVDDSASRVVAAGG